MLLARLLRPSPVTSWLAGESPSRPCPRPLRPSRLVRGPGCAVREVLAGAQVREIR